MKINTAYLETLKPCTSRFNHWKEVNSTFEGSLAEFLDLTNISHEDKIWVYFRSIDKAKAPLVAADLSESVLGDKYPEDKRPRLAIEAARTGVSATNAAYAAACAAASYAGGRAVHTANGEAKQITIMKGYL